MPSTVEIAVRKIGRKRGAGRRDHRVPGLEARLALELDLLDQQHRVAGDHAEQRQDAEDRHEAERPVAREQQAADDADHAQRQHRSAPDPCG
jgi:hypothetical protein